MGISIHSLNVYNGNNLYMAVRFVLLISINNCCAGFIIKHKKNTSSVSLKIPLWTGFIIIPSRVVYRSVFPPQN